MSSMEVVRLHARELGKRIEVGIAAIVTPGACNIPEIALPAALSSDAGTPNKGFDGDFVQAFSLFLGAPAEGSINGTGYSANRVLHAYIVGYAGTLRSISKCGDSEDRCNRDTFVVFIDAPPLLLPLVARLFYPLPIP